MLLQLTHPALASVVQPSPSHARCVRSSPVANFQRGVCVRMWVRWPGREVPTLMRYLGVYPNERDIAEVILPQVRACGHSYLNHTSFTPQSNLSHRCLHVTCVMREGFHPVPRT